MAGRDKSSHRLLTKDPARADDQHLHVSPWNNMADDKYARARDTSTTHAPTTRTWIAAMVTCILVAVSGCATMSRESESVPYKKLLLNGAEITYIDEGAGEPVVFLHSAVTDLRIWEAIRTRVASRYRFIAYSRRHHHPNGWPDDGATYDFDHHVRDFAALLDALGIEKAHVVAPSLGGQVAGRIVLVHPERVAAVVLNDSLLALAEPAQRTAAEAALVERFAPVRAAIARQDEKDAARTFVDWVAPETGGWEGLTPARQRLYLDNARTIMLRSRDSSPPIKCAEFSRVRLSVLVLGGERGDEAFRISNRRLAECFAGTAEFREIPEAGHFWYTTHADAGMAIILDFLARHPMR